MASNKLIASYRAQNGSIVEVELELPPGKVGVRELFCLNRRKKARRERECVLAIERRLQDRRKA